MTPQRPTVPDVLFWRLATLMCGLGFAGLALFVAIPEIDLLAAAAFHDGDGFPLRSDPALMALRALYGSVFAAFCVGLGLMLALRLVVRRGWRTPLRLWLFFGAALIAGPGLIANALFKENWGRARPDAVTAFGGDHPFTTPFALGEGCVSNCSFVSGEGAAAAALAFVLLAAFWPSLRGRRARQAAVAATGLWLAGAALIRMAPGKHFLSDTVFAFILMGLTAAALYRAFQIARVRNADTAGGAAQDMARASGLLAAAAGRSWRRLAASRGETRRAASAAGRATSQRE